MSRRADDALLKLLQLDTCKQLVNSIAPLHIRISVKNMPFRGQQFGHHQTCLAAKKIDRKRYFAQNFC